MTKLVEGLWDCPYCGQQGIPGLTKHCPTCSHPQDEGTVFYVGEKPRELDEEKAKNYGKGADWTCSFCDCLNRYDQEECSGCGAARADSQGSYTEKHGHQKIRARDIGKPVAKPEAVEPAAKPPVKSRRGLFAAIAFALIALLIFTMIPRKKQTEVIEKGWNRLISVEAEKTVQESGWSVPDGGRVTDQRIEIHHYEQVLDHYETVEVEKSRQVFDGYDEETVYKDNGDGTFTEEIEQTERYRTEYYIDYEDVPVYIDVPVEATKYYYDIERWYPERTVESEGGAEEPYWGELILGEKERESYREEHYMLTFRTDKDDIYQAEVRADLWNSLNKGDEVELTIKNGRVTQVNGQSIR